MTPFKEEGHHIVLELMYNKKHKRGCFVLDIVFGILKKTFKEFLTKTKLHVSFVPNALTTCCLLHNFLHSQSKSHIQILMHIIDVDLHVNPELNASWRVIEVVEEQAQTHIVEGQKISIEATCREQSIYLRFIT
jgi:hypothetical protein